MSRNFHLIFQFTVSGRLGVDGPPALSPVDLELDIEVGKLSDMLDMVVGDVVEVVGQENIVIEDIIVQV